MEQNYCNIYNVFNGSAVKAIASHTIDSVPECMGIPEDPPTWCADW